MATSNANGPILFLAPYSPLGSSDISPLGGANKIGALLRVLSESGRRIVLLNSAHNLTENRCTRVGRLRLTSEQQIAHVEPFTVRSRPIGKFLNLFAAARLAKRLARENPFLVWVYNGYAFDAMVAAKMHRYTQCQVVLEIEDWHTARDRGLSPKPQIDLWYLKKLLPKVSLATCVNENLCRSMHSFGLPTVLLPGILAPELADTAANVTAFSSEPYRLGYFGGLDKEKGVDVLLQLVPLLPNEWRMVITGTGPLAAACRLAASSDSRLSFYEGISPQQVFSLMRSCDAIANPHKSISSMGNGVFPFKVFEALAVERVLISTSLPPSGVDLQAVMWFDGSPDQLKQRLKEAPSFYNRNKSRIIQTAALVRQGYSERGVSALLSEAIPGLRLPR